MRRIELPTSPLPRECSTTELHGLTQNQCRTADGAGEGNRTLVLSLEGFSSTIKLHPLNHDLQHDALKNLVEGEGFEPSKAEPTDLQSVPVDRLGTPPEERMIIRPIKQSVNCSSERKKAGTRPAFGIKTCYFKAKIQATNLVASASVTLLGGIGT